MAGIEQGGGQSDCGHGICRLGDEKPAMQRRSRRCLSLPTRGTDLAPQPEKRNNLELSVNETDLTETWSKALADRWCMLRVVLGGSRYRSCPHEREARQARTGKLILAAEQEGDHILLTNLPMMARCNGADLLPCQGR